MGREISTVIEINAPVEKVYSILTNFDEYPQWNPFIKKASVNGEDKTLAEGKTLSVSMTLPGEEKLNTFTPKIVKVDAPKEFRWRGSLPIPFLFTGEHKFVLEQVSPTITKLYHGEEFQGLLVPLLGGILKKTEQGFISMNEALKKRAEETTS